MNDNDGNVREMTRTEKKFFNGVTIDANSTDGNYYEEDFHSQRRSYNSNTRKTYVIGSSNIFTRLIGSFIRGIINGNLLARIAAILIGIAFAALMFFIALPILFVILAIGIALLAFARISR